LRSPPAERKFLRHAAAPSQTREKGLSLNQKMAGKNALIHR
jgi:hypothetical protein